MLKSTICQIDVSSLQGFHRDKCDYLSHTTEDPNTPTLIQNAQIIKKTDLNRILTKDLLRLNKSPQFQVDKSLSKALQHNRTLQKRNNSMESMIASSKLFENKEKGNINIRNNQIIFQSQHAEFINQELKGHAQKPPLGHSVLIKQNNVSHHNFLNSYSNNISPQVSSYNSLPKISSEKNSKSTVKLRNQLGIQLQNQNQLIASCSDGSIDEQRSLPNKHKRSKFFQTSLMKEDSVIGSEQNHQFISPFKEEITKWIESPPKQPRRRSFCNTKEQNFNPLKFHCSPFI